MPVLCRKDVCIVNVGLIYTMHLAPGRAIILVFETKTAGRYKIPTVTTSAEASNIPGAGKFAFLDKCQKLAETFRDYRPSVTIWITDRKEVKDTRSNRIAFDDLERRDPGPNLFSECTYRLIYSEQIR